MRDEYAAGASAARNKIASHLTSHGIPVVPSSGTGPPTDDDFLEAALRGRSSDVLRAAPPADWTGPVFVDLGYVSGHGRTLRYDAGPRGGMFKAYLPRPLLPLRREDLVTVGLAATRDALPSSLVRGLSTKRGLAIGRYSYVDEKTRVLLFEGGTDGPRPESLYVPKMVFRDRLYTGELFLRVYV